MQVTQATIDKIKKMGMTKALASAKSGNKEFREGLRRMYGAKRLEKALGGMSSSAKQMNAAMANTKKVTKKAPSMRGLTPTQMRAKEGGTPRPGSRSIRPNSPLDKLLNKKNVKQRGQTAAQKRASESKTMRGVLTKKNGKRIPRSEMTPKQRRAYDLRMGAPKGNRKGLSLNPKTGQKNLDKYYGKK